MESKKPICSYCSHVDVCAYQIAFAYAQSVVDDLVVDLETTNIGIKTIYIRDVPFLKPIELVCKFYSNGNIITR